MFGRVLGETAQEIGDDEQHARELTSTLKLLVMQQRWFTDYGQQPLAKTLEYLMSNSDIQHYLEIYRFEDVLWFNKRTL